MSDARLAVDVVVFTVDGGALQVLLIRMKRPPFEGVWALPGGLLGARETVEQAAARELGDKTGLVDVFLEQLHTFSALDRDPNGRVVSVAFVACVPSRGAVLQTTSKYSAVGFCPVDRLPALAYDHAAMVAFARGRLRARLAWEDVAWSLLPSEFTLGELQATYEAVLGRALDPRNFRKRLAALDLVEETGAQRRGAAHRPARLYRFVRRRASLLEGEPGPAIDKKTKAS